MQQQPDRLSPTFSLWILIVGRTLEVKIRKEINNESGASEVGNYWPPNPSSSYNSVERPGDTVDSLCERISSRMASTLMTQFHLAHLSKDNSRNCLQSRTQSKISTGDRQN